LYLIFIAGFRSSGVFLAQTAILLYLTLSNQTLEFGHGTFTVAKRGRLLRALGDDSGRGKCSQQSTTIADFYAGIQTCWNTVLQAIIAHETTP